MPQQDYRARLQPKKTRDPNVLGPASSANILNPLHATNGVLFPYTPTINTGSVAVYETSGFVHTNYGHNAYVRSYAKPINISAEFTAQTTDEALYLLAVIHFFKSVTKTYFGINPYKRAGTPPPVILFNYLGEFQFDRVPVLVKNFDLNLDANVDYVPVNTAGLSSPNVVLTAGNKAGWSYVPTHITVAIELETQYIPIKLRDDFNLDEFRSGNLVGRGYM